MMTCGGVGVSCWCLEKEKLYFRSFHKDTTSSSRVLVGLFLNFLVSVDAACMREREITVTTLVTTTC